MAGSIERVTKAAKEAGLEIEVKRMGASTRTSQEAAAQCGCSVAQIVKSLIFQGETSDGLYLFLMQGSSRLDLRKAEALTGEPLKRADPRLIRERTGFAIGGVSPIGHMSAVKTYAENGLLLHETVWAAAGAHDAVFSARPNTLVAAARATVADIAE
ncbi:YbaK/EbsC family protein [Mesorhizobium sp. KR9-304]|uniref:YbaK/EbsC family protein n=1 Tax=Mesorhizobium sp. KR9-304 TaxID=3156614 RepID=UPI0032B4D015